MEDIIKKIDDNTALAKSNLEKLNKIFEELKSKINTTEDDTNRA